VSGRRSGRYGGITFVTGTFSYVKQLSACPLSILYIKETNIYKYIIHRCVYIRIYTYAHGRTFALTSVCMYVLAYVCIYVCTYVYIFLLFLLHVILQCVILHEYDQLISILLNASFPLFHQQLVFIVYESPLGLEFVSLSIKIAIVNLKKTLKCFLISSGLLVVCMYVCMYLCMYVCTYVCMYVYMYVRIMYLCMHVYMYYVSVYGCMYVYMYIYICVCIYVCMYYVCVYACIYVLCMCVCMYGFMYVRMYVCMYV
jgi:hypothetical protein